MQHTISCWCSNTNLANFSSEYFLCTQCQTLVSKVGLTPEKIAVQNDEEDFYGKNYWLSHQSHDLGYPDIYKRARTDLSERCLHWLKATFKYKLPPARTIELGCAHGGFVSLLKHCGYEASGLEMSPWIAEFAAKTFQIPMNVGPIEKQTFSPGSFDLIILMDVFEHLSDPIQTMQSCLKFLKDDGILMIQTPCYPVGVTHAEMSATQSPFLSQLKSDEHLYLFSQESIKQFFENIGEKEIHIQFEPAMFHQYDMFVMVSRTPFKTNSPEEINHFLTSSPETRLIQAMLDLAEQRDAYIQLFKQADQDRIARLEIIEKLTSKNEIKFVC